MQDKETTNGGESGAAANVPEQFIGPFKVLGITPHATLKTPSGAEVVEVLYESGGMKQIMPLKTFQKLALPQPTDLSDLGERKIAILRDAMIDTILEHDATALELQTVLQRVSNKISNVYDRVGHYLFTKEVYGKGADNTWVPGTNFTHYRSVLECDAVLKQLGNDDAKPQNITDK